MREVLYALIRSFEGLFLRRYRCPAGIWTCGYGSTGPDVNEGTPEWTREYAEQRMRQDAELAIHVATKYCPLLKDNEVAAVADFVYNLGATRLKASTLRRKLNNRDLTGARRELLRWTKGGGKVLPGLVKRRQAEAQLLN